MVLGGAPTTKENTAFLKNPSSYVPNLEAKRIKVIPLAATFFGEFPKNRGPSIDSK